MATVRTERKQIMIPVLIEATLLSLIALKIMNELHIFPIRDGLRLKRTFAPLRLITSTPRVLIKGRIPEGDACVMLSAHSMTLLEELQSILLAKFDSATRPGPIEAHILASISSQTEEPALSSLNDAPDPLANELDSSTTEAR
jgi:hypothetical protein